MLDAHSVTTLRLRPFLAFRSVEECTHENASANRHYDVIDNGIKTRLYPGYPELMMQLNKKNEFVYEPNWYRGIEYQKEQELGYDYKEDLYVPGYFEFNIKKGESVVFAAGLSELKSTQLKRSSITNMMYMLLEPISSHVWSMLLISSIMSGMVKLIS